eukprot:TRINITY_DN21340_c0_g1_i1.p2 TRINITY_DN21340_c0_g1~~TRINITY_DN21340_c0_g1_i1.p2  ORF type:complete len:301 (-),score=50.46 TRINITY_DN21340_c0_g1_i1:802-1704(-)
MESRDGRGMDSAYGDGYDTYYGGRSRSGGGMDRDRDRDRDRERERERDRDRDRDSGDMPPPRGGVPPGLGAGRGFRGTPENAKTKLCMRWMSGDCRFGDRCNFAHGESELRRGSGRDEGPPYHDRDRNGYPSRDGYYEGRGSYRDHRDLPPRDYDQSPPRRGERGPPYSGNGVPYPRGSGYGPPSRSSSGYERRGDLPPPRGDGSRDYYPPSRGSGGDIRGAPYHSKDDGSHSPTHRPNYSEKPSGMSDQVWEGSGYPVPGPSGWWRYTTDKGEHYYHNYRSHITQWDKPDGWTVVAVPR